MIRLSNAIKYINATSKYVIWEQQGFQDILASQRV